MNLNLAPTKNPRKTQRNPEKHDVTHDFSNLHTPCFVPIQNLPPQTNPETLQPNRHNGHNFSSKVMDSGAKVAQPKSANFMTSG